MQVQAGNEQASKANKELRKAIVRGSEVVACTLSSAGGDLLTLCKNSTGFQALIIDEVKVKAAFMKRNLSVQFTTEDSIESQTLLPKQSNQHSI